nr:hAT transposon family protein [Rickettsia endosymbiont of Ceutorhynchus assimilis]
MVFRFVSRKTPKPTLLSKISVADSQTQESEAEVPGPSGPREKILKLTSQPPQKRLKTVPVPDSSSDSSDTEGSGPHSDSQREQNIIKKPIKKRYAQKFKEEWKTKYSWLRSMANNKVLCTTCNTPLGCSTFNIKRHQASEIHKKNIRKVQNTPKIDSVIFDESTLKKHQLVKQAELKICAFLHEHNLPFLLADHLSKFIPSICPDSDIAKQINCSRTKATYITNDCLSVEQLEEISSILQKNKFSLIIDETTDISTQKSLALVVRYYDETLKKVRDSFFGLLKLDSSNAKSIFLGVQNYLTKCKVPLENLIGFAADNASVMQGNRTGVQARFKEVLPNIYTLGCVCHSVHLCASAAANKLPRSVEDFVRNIYNYFSNSSKRIDQLNECQIFCQVKPNKLLHPAQTRWLSLQAAVDRVLENWDALIIFFTNETFDQNLHSCNNILISLKNSVYKLYFYFLSYILDITNKLNLEFQSEKNKLHVLLKRVSDLFKNILRNYLDPEYIRANENNLKNIDPKNPRNFLTIDKVYLGTKVEVLSQQNINQNDLANFKLKCLEFYVELSSQLKSRFDFEDPILNFVSIFDPKEAMSGKVSSIAVASSKYFPNLITDLEKLNSEWRLLPDVNHLRNYTDLDLEQFWNIVFTMKNGNDEPMFPNLSHFVKGILCLPHSSAAAERIFSQLFLLKTKVRNRLNIDTCCNILHTKEMINPSTCFSWKPSTNLMKRKFRC